MQCAHANMKGEEEGQGHTLGHGGKTGPRIEMPRLSRRSFVGFRCQGLLGDAFRAPPGFRWWGGGLGGRFSPHAHTAWCTYTHKLPDSYGSKRGTLKPGGRVGGVRVGGGLSSPGVSRARASGET